MNSNDHNIEDLKQELLDERSMRLAAEQRSAELNVRVETWRIRAEERAQRIDRLVAERPGPLLGWLRSKAPIPPLDSSPSRSTVARDRVGRSFPLPGLRSIRVAGHVSDPGAEAALAAMDYRRIEERHQIEDADLVVIDSAALNPAEGAEGLRSLLNQRVGPPILVWDLPTSSLSVRDESWHSVAFPPSFEPSVCSPASQWRIQDPELIAPESRVRSPDSALIEHAAAGGVVLSREGTEMDEHSRSISSAVARRWAYRNHAPWIRAAQLAEACGIGVFDPWPSVAGILVSNRPEMVPGALESMARQTYPRLSLVVGLHGVGDKAAIAEHAERLGITHRTRIIEISESETLGHALNRCIDLANADVVAKIDDDDVYGPAYIEDAVHALAYSGCGIVGKATQFTYFADRGVTVLRRPGTEETRIEGTLTGASLVFRRSVWEANKFPHRPRQVDVHFLRGARLAGIDLYATSRWEFRYFRGHGDHTWNSDDETLMAGAVPMFYGEDPTNVHALGWPLDAR